MNIIDQDGREFLKTPRIISQFVPGIFSADKDSEGEVQSIMRVLSKIYVRGDCCHGSIRRWTKADTVIYRKAQLLREGLNRFIARRCQVDGQLHEAFRSRRPEDNCDDHQLCVSRWRN